MEFIYKGNHGIEIKFEEDDNDTDKRIVEQGVAFIRNLLVRMSEPIGKENPVKVEVK